MSRFSRAFEPLYAAWRQDIKLFAREALNFDYTWQQEELFDLVQYEYDATEPDRKKRIAVASGQGPGKTAASVIVAMHRTIRYPGAVTIVTSPSMRQCKQWIDEAKRLIKDAHPLLQKFITCYNTRIDINGDEIWGIRTATATRPQNLQGIHEKHLTFIADEASGVAQAIMETIKGTLSNPDALFLQIGNPNTTDCDFYNSFTTFLDEWHTLRWNAEDTARDYPHIVSPSRNEALAREYGIESDVYRVRVMGEFPHQNPRALMSMEDLIACTKTSREGCASIDGIIEQMRAIGIDYARYGSDESVIVRRLGLSVMEMEVFVKQDPRITTDRAFTMQADAGWQNSTCWYVPDAGGMGQGIIHTFYDAKKQVFEFMSQRSASDGSMFANMASEAWWQFRGLVKERICHIPYDLRLLKQLGTREYKMDKDGKIAVETKDDWRDRLETDESPDRADAIVQAFYRGVVEAKVATGSRARGAAVGKRTGIGRRV